MTVCDKSVTSAKTRLFTPVDSSEPRVRSITKVYDGEAYKIHIFRACLRPYGKEGLCVKLPSELSSVLDSDRRDHLWFVEMFYADEEHAGPVHMFHKFLRTVGGYDCFPIPSVLVGEIDDVVWTVVMSPLNKYMLKQYDGFVYPRVVVNQTMFDFSKILDI